MTWRGSWWPAPQPSEAKDAALSALEHHQLTTAEIDPRHAPAHRQECGLSRPRAEPPTTDANRSALAADFHQRLGLTPTADQPGEAEFLSWGLGRGRR